MDLLINYRLFTFRSTISHSYGDTNTVGEGQLNKGLYLAVRAFEQGGVIIVPHLLWHKTSKFSGLVRGTPPVYSPSTTC
jgi:hypothetical protein